MKNIFSKLKVLDYISIIAVATATAFVAYAITGTLIIWLNFNGN